MSFALPDPRERPWLSVAELSEISGEGQKVIRAAVAAGQLPSLRLGRYVRIPTHLLMQKLGMDTPDIDPAPPDIRERPGAETGAIQSVQAGGLRLDTSISQPTDSTQQASRRGGIR